MIHHIIATTTPLLLAAFAGLVTEMAGTLNIGLEGLILIGAFASTLGALATGSFAIGALAGAIAGAAFTTVFTVFVFRLRANPFIVGLGINLLAVGLTAFLSTVIFQTAGVIALDRAMILRYYEIPGVSDVPVLGTVVSGYTFFTPAAWALAALSIAVLSLTRFGLVLRATGIDPSTVSARGKNPLVYKRVAIVYSGLLCGLAGAALSLKLGAFVPNMSAGRGWIALVAVFLGRRRPVGVALAALLFAGAEYGSNALQGTMQLPKTLALSIPYIVTLSSMVLFAVVKRSRPD